ncbi:NAD(P)H-binding protein [Olivibacter sp. XZL3]|uniref:NAD(P)H-binding protein n=1 Tax=Olivibacter sp. XZL3 TaxID=1735116 RepID=UPI001066507D|nr:NAD(P)H-binding protein [Olivibacter sp. XZL3]
MKKAVLFGASGFIGSHLLSNLLSSENYEVVTVVVRRKLDIHHPKLKVLIGDYQNLSALKEDIVADEVFIALGTTKNKTPQRQAYYEVDHDYPVLAAKIAQERGARAVFLVTAVGANSKAAVFYLRTKGEAERDLIALNFEHTHIFRPSMLMGNRKESRPLERFFMAIWWFIGPLLIGKGLEKYRGITGENVAKAMINAAQKQTEKIKIYHWREMHDLLV